MNKTRKVIALFLLTASVLQSQEKGMNTIEDIISSVEKTYIPDRRLQVWDIGAAQEENATILYGETTNKAALETLLSEAEKPGIRVVNQIKLLPSLQVIPKDYGVVSVSVANMRKLPEHSQEMVSQALMGTVVRVLKMKGGWYLIQTPDGYLGWAEDDAITRMKRSDAESYLAKPRIVITAPFTFLREEPREDSFPVTDIVAGSILTSLKAQGEWVKSSTADGREGFIPLKHCQDWGEWVRAKDFQAGELIRTALLLMGVPYLWGGTSAKGLDCSGFTKTVYFLNGILLQRDASQQYHQGRVISEKPEFRKFLAGDLLFFGKRTPDGRELATHVALYIGDGRYIHSSGRVRINSLDITSKEFNEHRFSTFLRATRLLGELPNECRLLHNSFYTIGK